MLNNCCDAMEFDLRCQQEILRRMKRRRRQLDGHPREFLTMKLVNGRAYYSRRTCEGGVVTAEYLNKGEIEYRREMQEIKFLDTAIPHCESNIRTLSKALAQYKCIDPDIVKESLPRAYREQENAMNLIFGYEKSSKWKEKKLNEKKRFIEKHGDYMEENHKHLSSDGVSVVSKSELAMIELLNAMGIPFVYEYPRFFDGEIKRPDFLCLNVATGKEFYFEHVGFLADENYSNKFTHKMSVYARAGVIPNVNLLLTYEDMDGNIDLHAARLLLEAYLK